jgi:antitoxin (DNA-binding transcriptional repressor) of toxin-antitoxin stability system
MDNVQATGEPVVITKRGVPVVKLMPAGGQSDVFGFMASEFRIAGDIESPVVPLDQWQVLKETDLRGTHGKGIGKTIAKRGKK